METAKKALIGVIADTETDIRMVHAFLEDKGYRVIPKPVRQTAAECIRFFREPQGMRDDYITLLIKQIMEEGGEAVFVYGNSVCGYVQFDYLAGELNIPIVTPFHAYEKLGEAYAHPFVWAATTGALSGIERSLRKTDFDKDVRGAVHLDIAKQIEAGKPADQIIKDNAIADLIRYNEKSGSDSIFLGCTYYPYLKAEVEKIATVPVIDPAETMCGLLEKALQAKA